MKRSAVHLLILLLLFTSVRHAASAENTMSAGAVTVQPGDTGVVVPISATTDQQLTLLSVTLSFDAALCQSIQNQTLVRVGRTVGTPQEDGIRCPSQPKVAIVLFDLSGGVVLPVGSGEIIHWIFDVKPGASGATYPITVTVNQASDGPVPVTVTPSDGKVTIVGPMCAGDCNGDGHVSIDELLVAVNMALGTDQTPPCAALSPGGTAVTITEVMAAVNAALNGCSP